MWLFNWLQLISTSLWTVLNDFWNDATSNQNNPKFGQPQPKNRPDHNLVLYKFFWSIGLNLWTLIVATNLKRQYRLHQYERQPWAWDHSKCCNNGKKWTHLNPSIMSPWTYTKVHTLKGKLTLTNYKRLLIDYKS